MGGSNDRHEATRILEGFSSRCGDFGGRQFLLYRDCKCGKKVEALIVSHGHYDHFGGLIGFLDKFRNDLPADLTLYAGGEDNFCTRHQVSGPQGGQGGAAGQLSEWGTLDRRELGKRNVKTVLAENPVVIGHAFTTGRIKRRTLHPHRP